MTFENIMKAINKIFVLVLSMLSLNLMSQHINDKFEKWQVGEKAINITGIDISPDESQIAMVCGKKQPLIIYDLESRTILKEIDVKTEYLGYNVNYSTKGNYLLLQEKKVETSFKKVKKADYSVVDVNSGKVLHRYTKINDAKISFDEKFLITLEQGTIYIRDLRSGNEIRKFSPEEACNAIAISPDGKDIAVVIKPNKQEVTIVPSVSNNKKAIKANAKMKHMIAIYDSESFELKKLIPEIYDNINLLYYTENGKRLLSFNVATNHYINVVEVPSYEPIRESYLGKTSTQPEFGYSPNLKYFAISTVNTYPSVNVYSVATGSMVDTYDTEMRIWKNIKKKIYAGTNTSFLFLPNNKEILIAYGNSLILWKHDKE